MNKIKKTVNTTGHSTLELVKEIDEASDDMSKELLLQKMKINILETLIVSGQKHLQKEYDHLLAGASSGDINAEDQKSVDDLLSQFDL